MRWRWWILGGLLVALLVAYVGGFFLCTEFQVTGHRTGYSMEIRWFPSERARWLWTPMRTWDDNVHARSIPWLVRKDPSLE